MARMARLIDVTRCTACRGCQVACKNWNQLEAEIGPFTGSYQSHEDNSPGRWTMIKFYEQTDAKGDLSWYFRKNSCMHCGDPGCLKACPNKALAQTENGAVINITENCIGCGYCVPHCPFDIPKVDEVAGKMKKCSFCYDRISNGQQPICAKTCITEAIVFDTFDNIVNLANERLQVAKERFPNANVYGVDDLDGLGVIYILPEPPNMVGLPVEPTLHPTLGLWKDVVHPLGKFAVGASIVATGLAFLFSRRKAFKLSESAKLAEGGFHDESKNDRAL
jgi:formate dehydrogenase iron-sulfur subunit